MEEDFLPFNLSDKLKNLGFNDKCFARVSNIFGLHINGTKRGARAAVCDVEVPSPTWSQAIDFLIKQNNPNYSIKIFSDWHGSYFNECGDILFFFNNKEDLVRKLIRRIK